MLTLHKKVNKRETLIGWYSFCKKIMNNDPIINKILYSYTKKPLFILLWVDRLINGLIIEAYFGKKFNSNKNQIFQKKKDFYRDAGIGRYCCSSDITRFKKMDKKISVKYSYNLFSDLYIFFKIFS